MLASDVPSTSMATTVATGIRNPRMHGTRPICFWFTVIRVNLIVLAPSCPRRLSYLGSSSIHQAFPLAAVRIQGRQCVGELKKIQPALGVPQQGAQDVSPAGGPRQEGDMFAVWSGCSGPGGKALVDTAVWPIYTFVRLPRSLPLLVEKGARVRD